MRKIYTLLALFPFTAFAQSPNENYIKNIIYKLPTATALSTPTPSQAKQVVTYFDGLGRPKQTIDVGQSAVTSRDLITPIIYDPLSRKSHQYLPYVRTGAPMSYDVGGVTAQSTFYSNPIAADTGTPFFEASGNAYTQTIFESSPLNRIQAVAAPGNSWALVNNHTLKYTYLANATNEVKLLKANASATSGLYSVSLVNNIYYPANKLFKTIIKNENWVPADGDNNTTHEFKDFDGKLILKRVFGESMINNIPTNTNHDTYYVYDQFNNLTFVIPPKVDILNTVTVTILDNLCYQYKYDARNRLVEKKLPGKGWDFIVYDKLNRQVAIGPAYSPYGTGSMGWMINKFDKYDRVVYTGWYPGTVDVANRVNLQNLQNGLNTTLNETKLSSGIVNNIPAYYSNLVAPTTFELLTVNYYDDYAFPNAPTFPLSVMTDGSQPVHYNNTDKKPVGLITGTWIRALQSISQTSGSTSYFLYDSKARIVREWSNNILGGFNQKDTKIDFSGKPIKIENSHKRLSSNNVFLTVESLTYSPQDLLLTHTHQLPARSPELICDNKYDEFGRLISKRIGGISNANNPLQEYNYAYNIRGWLSELNTVFDGGGRPPNPVDLFALKINYDIVTDNAPGVVPQYNGNISESFWKAKDGVVRKYGYRYDQLGRLREATYQKPLEVPIIRNSYDEKVDYDKNGNIVKLWRTGDFDSPIPPAVVIDDLTYSYKSNNSTNQLATVIDNAGADSWIGFKKGNLSTNDDYEYDSFGNLFIDRNKGISNITYNHLHLPVEILFSTIPLKKISFVYDATGVKLQKIVQSGASTTTTDYINGYQYKNSVLQYFPTSEGYVNYDSGIYKYVYNYTDHLGSNRLSYTEDVVTGNAAIMEQNHYYPFGLKHTNYGTTVMKLRGSNLEAGLAVPYKYKYNGKEWQDELGLNFYDYGARNYDPAIGRWMNIDTKSELYVNTSPYNYALNSPVNAIDPDGKLVIFVNGYFSRIGNIVGASPGQPLQPYWNFFNRSFIGSARDFLGASNTEANYFVDGSSNVGFDQSGPGRYDLGFEYAKQNYNNIISQMAEGETLKFVGHSEGSAFAAGMMAYFIDRGMNDASTPKIESSLHLSPDEADEFGLPDYGGTDYQIHNDNDPISPFHVLAGAEFVVRGKGSSKAGAHGNTVTESALNRLKKAIDTFIGSDVQQTTSKDGTMTWYIDPAKQGKSKRSY